MRNQAPPHEGKLPEGFLRMLADHRNGLSWGDIEPSSPVVIPRGRVEKLFDNLFSPRQSVASAH